MEFNQKLSALMKERGMTNYRLAKALNCSQSSVANWIAGEVKPQNRTIDQLCAVFGVTRDELFGTGETGVAEELYEDDRVLLHSIGKLKSEDKRFIKELIKKMEGSGD